MMIIILFLMILALNCNLMNLPNFPLHLFPPLFSFYWFYYISGRKQRFLLWSNSLYWRHQRRSFTLAPPILLSHPCVAIYTLRSRSRKGHCPQNNRLLLISSSYKILCFISVLTRRNKMFKIIFVLLEIHLSLNRSQQPLMHTNSTSKPPGLLILIDPPPTPSLPGVKIKFRYFNGAHSLLFVNKNIIIWQTIKLSQCR